MLTEIIETAEKFNIPATFFEMTTAFAFGVFNEEHVDAAVLEVGLGYVFLFYF